MSNFKQSGSNLTCWKNMTYKHDFDENISEKALKTVKTYVFRAQAAIWSYSKSLEKEKEKNVLIKLVQLVELAKT